MVDAHGASGIGRDCAPSLMRDLYHGNQMMQFVERGFAVVAPDYAGLGTDGRQEIVNKTAESNDVIYAQRAARRARRISRLGGCCGVTRKVVAPRWRWLSGNASYRSPDTSALSSRRRPRTCPRSPTTWRTPRATGPSRPCWPRAPTSAIPGSEPDRLLTPAAYSRLGITAIGCLGAARRRTPI